MHPVRMFVVVVADGRRLVLLLLLLLSDVVCEVLLGLAVEGSRPVELELAVRSSGVSLVQMMSRMTVQSACPAVDKTILYARVLDRLVADRQAVAGCTSKQASV